LHEANNRKAKMVLTVTEEKLQADGNSLYGYRSIRTNGIPGNRFPQTPQLAQFACIDGHFMMKRSEISVRVHAIVVNCFQLEMLF